MAALNYQMGNGRLCREIEAAIDWGIEVKDQRPILCLVNRRPALLPRTVNGVRVRTSKGVPPKKIKLVF